MFSTQEYIGANLEVKSFSESLLLFYLLLFYHGNLRPKDASILSLFTCCNTNI
jgi:hypothetical protein